METLRYKWLRISAAACLLCCSICTSQVPSQRQTISPPPPAGDIDASSNSTQSQVTKGREELQRGTSLTRQGRFTEAIPHLQAARADLGNDYGLEFNLSLCYVGVGEYARSIRMLDELRQQGHENADVENLLAQAYIGNGQPNEALAAAERAAAISPKNEKLFAFVADACRDTRDFELGLQVIDIGLRGLPQSARLHYERAVFLTELDQFDRAKHDFELAARMGQGSDVGYTAEAHERLLEGDVPAAIRAAREGVAQGIQNPGLLLILGKALLLSGIAPGQPEFAEARNALEKVASERPTDAGALIALGQLDLLSGRIDDAIARLETAQKLTPDQASIYAGLARAYQRKGDTQRAKEAITTLERLNQAQADRIRNAPGERKNGYTGIPSAQPK
jgi:tetratricopeptide (TPR) repeat protein